MIGPGLIVAVTLASAHASATETSAETPARGIAGAFRGLTEAEVTALVGELSGLGSPAPPAEGADGSRAHVGLPFTAALLAARAAGDAPNAKTLPAEAGALSVETTSEPTIEKVELRLGAVVAEEPDEPDAPPFAMADTVTLDPARVRGLSKDFVARLRRVAERMWDEHGLHVEVVEGYRTQGRQDALFTQGRTTPGPVVTWTRSSMHTDGLAADLFIGGAPVTARDALMLADIAREEGLSTLYPLDSGHIQLDVPGADSGPEGPLPRTLSPKAGSVPAPRRGVAPVAPVAPVARPASASGIVMKDGIEAPQPLAQVVGPSMPHDLMAQAVSSGAEDDRGGALGSRTDVGAGFDRSAGSSEARATDPGVTAPDTGAARTVVRAVRGASGGALGEEAEGRQKPDEARPAAEASGAPGNAPAQSATTVRPFDLAAPTSQGPAHVGPPSPTSGEGRTTVGSVIDPTRFEVAENRPYYQQLHVPIEGLNGSASLRVGLSGTTVRAQLSLSDPVLAGELRGRLQELRHQLADRGVQSGELSVRVVSDTAAETAARPATGSEQRTSAQAASGGSTSDTGSQQGRPGRSLDPDDRRDRGDARRRNPQEEETAE